MIIINTEDKYKISLSGAVFMIAGTVIGAGIYILIGSLAVKVGPGLFLCYLLALIVAASSSLCYAQVSSIYPITAASYEYAKMFYNEYVGFIIGWLRLMTGFYGLALMGMGFTEYINSPLGIDNRLIAIGFLFIFYVINMLGIKTTQRIQTGLVSIVVLGLLFFAGFGVLQIELKNLIPVTAAGTGPIISGAMTAFFAYTGMYFVAEIGDEIKNPQKNIPKSIIVASIIIGILYITTSLVFSGSLGWPLIKAEQPNLAEAGALLFGPVLSRIIQISAVIAVIMPINAIYAGGSRLVYSLANDKFLPPILSKLNRFMVPGWALTGMFLLASLVVVMDVSILYLGTITSIVTLMAMSLVAGASIKLKKSEPEKFEKAPFELPPPVLYTVVVITLISAVVLSLFSFIEDPMIFYSLVFWIVLGSIYYVARNKLLSHTEKREFKVKREKEG